MKCSRKRAVGRRRGYNVSRLPVLASIGPLIEGAVVVAAFVVIAILLRNP